MQPWDELFTVIISYDNALRQAISFATPVQTSSVLLGLRCLYVIFYYVFQPRSHYGFLITLCLDYVLEKYFSS